MGEVHCRLARAEDYPSLRRLWSENTDWGPLADAVWQLVMEGNPSGPAVIVVAERLEPQEAVGQLVFLPTVLSVGDRDYPVLRAFAPIVVKGSRSGHLGSLFGPEHPFLLMLRYGIDHLGAEGFRALYGMPNPRFVRLLRTLPGFTVLTFPLYSRALSAVIPKLDADLRWRPYQADERFAELCDRARYPVVHLRRRPDVLQWRGLVTGQEYVSVEDGDGRLRAVAAGRPHGHRQWQIEDVIAQDEESRRAAVIAALAHGQAIAARQAAEVRMSKAAILAVPAMEPLLVSLGFARETYEFALATAPLGGFELPELKDKESWYLAAGD